MRLLFSGPIVYSSLYFSSISLGQSSWFFGEFRCRAIFRFLLFLQAFHNWTAQSLPYDGCAGILGGALLSAIHGVTVENTYEDGEQVNTFRGFQSDQEEETYSMVTNRFWSKSLSIAFSNKRWAPFLYAFCSRYGHGPLALGLLVWLLILEPYDFVSQELSFAEDPEFETFEEHSLERRSP